MCLEICSASVLQYGCKLLTTVQQTYIYNNLIIYLNLIRKKLQFFQTTELSKCVVLNISDIVPINEHLGELWQINEDVPLDLR